MGSKTIADCVFSFNPDSGYGLVKRPRDLAAGEHRFRPVIGAYATVASLLAGSDALKPISDYPRDIYAYRFQKDDRIIYAAWATEEAKVHEVLLPLKDGRTVTRVNLFGDEQVEDFDFSRPYPLPVNGDPVFLIEHVPH